MLCPKTVNGAQDTCGTKLAETELTYENTERERDRERMNLL